jgi:two-component system secretion response regulator SsrB
MTSRLTPREQEVFALYAQGFGDQEIAEQLTIASKTVETHKHNVRIKLGLEFAPGRLNLRRAAIAWYIEREVRRRLAA